MKITMPEKFKHFLRQLFLKTGYLMFSGPEEKHSLVDKHYVRKAIALGYPMGHHTEFVPLALVKGDPGLGILYYALVRSLKPQTVLCIGSFRGFSFIMYALGLKDNGRGHLYFIDPSYVDDFWAYPENVEHQLAQFGLNKWVTHFKQTTQEALNTNKLFNQDPFIDVLYIDGDHTYDGVKFDFEMIGAFVKKSGYIIFHDAVSKERGFTQNEVYKLLAEIDPYKFEKLTLPVGSGIAILRKLI